MPLRLKLDYIQIGRETRGGGGEGGGGEGGGGEGTLTPIFYSIKVALCFRHVSICFKTLKVRLNFF